MDLLNFLEENENTRKIFGEKELGIIKRQLWGVKLKQSEKNRLSRDIRKKFEFIKEINGRTFDLKLKRMSLVNKIVEDTLEVIKEDKLFKNIKKIMLFGSHVKNEVTFRSDIDICAVFNKINLREATKFRIRISGRSSDKIDIQVFNVLPKKIKSSILNKNRVLYERKSERG